MTSTFCQFFPWFCMKGVIYRRMSLLSFTLQQLLPVRHRNAISNYRSFVAWRARYRPINLPVCKSANWVYGSIHKTRQIGPCFFTNSPSTDIKKLMYQYVITPNSVEIFQGNRRAVTLVKFGPVTSTNEADVHHDLP